MKDNRQVIKKLEDIEIQRKESNEAMYFNSFRMLTRLPKLMFSEVIEDIEEEQQKIVDNIAQGIRQQELVYAEKTIEVIKEIDNDYIQKEVNIIDSEDGATLNKVSQHDKLFDKVSELVKIRKAYRLYTVVMKMYKKGDL